MKFLNHITRIAAAFIFTVVAGLASTQNPASTQNSTPDPDVASVHFSLHAMNDSDQNYFEDVDVVPGETVPLEVLVVNWQTEPVTIRLYVTNATNSINGGFLAGSADEELVGSAAWLELPAQDLTLDGNEQRVVLLAVTVPEDAEPGQYISALVAETVDTLPIPGADIIDHRIRYAISVGILVPGELTPSFELGEPVLIEQSLDIPITNTGNYIVRPQGEIELRDGDGEVVLSSPIELGSVYAGISTTISLWLPVQVPDDDYSLTLRLADADSVATASLEGVTVTVTEAESEPTVQVQSASIEPNDDDLVYVTADLMLINLDDQVPVTILIGVYRNGELVEEIPLATNQIFLVGENSYSTRYIPEKMWESGSYTFDLNVYAVDPNSGQQFVLLNEPLDSEIIVP